MESSSKEDMEKETELLSKVVRNEMDRQDHPLLQGSYYNIESPSEENTEKETDLSLSEVNTESSSKEDMEKETELLSKVNIESSSEENTEKETDLALSEVNSKSPSKEDMEKEIELLSKVNIESSSEESMIKETDLALSKVMRNEINRQAYRLLQDSYYDMKPSSETIVGKEVDPELSELVQNEIDRQTYGLNLIANENISFPDVLRYRSSELHNKYYDKRINIEINFCGAEYVIQLEQLAQKRCLDAFNLDPNKWGCNVQPFSRSLANLAVFSGVCEPGGRILGLDIKDSNDTIIGCNTLTRKMSAMSLFFETMPYSFNHHSGEISYNEIATVAPLFNPTIITVVASAFPRLLNYKPFKLISEVNDAYFLVDISDIAGLIAAKVIPGPFEHCDIVTMATHMTLRGPRGAVIFYRKGIRSERNNKIQHYDIEYKINYAVSCLQDGYQTDVIASIAAIMYYVKNNEFIKYQRRTVANAKKLCQALSDRNYKIVTNGTDFHFVVVDLRPLSIEASRAEKALSAININCSKCCVPGDKTMLQPYGLKFGMAELTSRKLCRQIDIHKIATLIDRGLSVTKKAICLAISVDKSFDEILANDKEILDEIDCLKEQVKCVAIDIAKNEPN